MEPPRLFGRAYLFVISIPNLHLGERLKFVQMNEEFAQKLSTPILQDNRTFLAISKKL